MQSLAEWVEASFTALVAGAGLYWLIRQVLREEEEASAALSVSISPNKVIKLANRGNLPLTIAVVRFGLAERSREQGLCASCIIQTLSTAGQNLERVPAFSKAVLSPSDEISIFVNDELSPIEEKDLVVFRLEIVYSTRGKAFRKYIDAYQLTSLKRYEQYAAKNCIDETSKLARIAAIKENPGRGVYEDEWHIMSISYGRLTTRVR